MPAKPIHHIMFDVDGTLVQSNEIDGELFCAAVHEETGLTVDTNWSRYCHVTNAGILYELVAAAGDVDRLADINRRVENNFCARIKDFLALKPLRAVAGAAQMIDNLLARGDVVVSIATGGWRPTARLKLNSAGLSYPQMPLASSNDHYRRIDIMQIAARRATADPFLPCTYFGDGVWDKMASAELGYDFVLVGNAATHHRRIDDFSDLDRVLALLGLAAATTTRAPPITRIKKT